MKTIWKYKLAMTDEISIDMPVGAEILTVQMQEEIPVLWVLVDSKNPITTRYFELFGTGNPIKDLSGSSYQRKYINTFQMSEGRLVFHLFEKTLKIYH